MIGYVQGKVTRLDLDSCIIDVQGLGYRVTIPLTTRERINLGDSILLHTHLHVREDGWSLYGFYTEEEYEMYVMLLSVSGIGPKVACGIVSSTQPAVFYEAIRMKNKAVLMKLPGIGKKSAERLLLELKDKVPGLPVEEVEELEVPLHSLETTAVSETIRALTGLGYTEQEVRPVALRLQGEYSETGTLLRMVLNELGRGRNA